MKRWIRANDEIDQAAAELRTYSEHPSMDGYVHNILIDIKNDRLSVEDVQDAVLIAEICYNAAENICDATGLYPEVTSMYTLRLPDPKGVVRYESDWTGSLHVKSPDLHVQFLTTRWIAAYQRTLKQWYASSTYHKTTPPREYADEVLHEDLQMLAEGTTICDEDIAEEFIVKTVMPTYQRNK